ncbi:TlpA family protein disulfide reductase [Elizabethkingia anophelis]|nr:TlpA family protein disulfide reductase [Elizabethkingia anophelis]MCT4276877.1 TlpA family protein disulfide reductase [Elizabethkingia anophelis]MCT4280028.1 TlpA family protein disulfide reductase [Elizabethkingia anophelis]
MKKALLSFVLLVNILVFSQDAQEKHPSPVFSITNENGTIKSSDLKGKVVLINFFATWCAPCMEELPLLQKEIWEKYKDNKKFSLLVIGREHSQDEITAFKAKKGFTLPMYPDKTKSVYSLFAKQSIPRNYIVDTNGSVIYASVGFDEAEFKNMLNKLDELLE